MKRNKIKYDRWLRMLFLSFALLTGGGWMAWGEVYRTCDGWKSEAYYYPKRCK